MTDLALLVILISRKGIFPFLRHKKGVFQLPLFALLENTGDFLFRSIKGFWLLMKNCPRRKRIESESRSGMLYKRQEKAMVKTMTTKLCFMLAMLNLVCMADAVANESKGR